MDHLLSCECGREHVVARSQAGQEVQCECGRSLRVPTLRGLAELPVAASTAAPSPETERKRARWAGWRGPAIAVAAGGFFIALLVGSRFLLQWYLSPTGYTTEMEVEAGIELLDRADPEELSYIWDTFQKMGMRTKNRPGFYIWAVYARERLILAAISGGVAAFFGLAAGVIWLTARREKSA